MAGAKMFQGRPPPYLITVGLEFRPKLAPAKLCEMIDDRALSPQIMFLEILGILSQPVGRGSDPIPSF